MVETLTATLIPLFCNNLVNLMLSLMIIFAPLTLFIKGTEGYLSGLIGNSRRQSPRIAGVAVGASAMLIGYFSVEAPLYGVGPAFAELALVNSIQVTVGAAVSLAVAHAIFRADPDLQFFKPRSQGKIVGALIILIAAVALTTIVAIYMKAGISP